jgi:hypothetical protein
MYIEQKTCELQIVEEQLRQCVDRHRSTVGYRATSPLSIKDTCVDDRQVTKNPTHNLTFCCLLLYI